MFEFLSLFAQQIYVFVSFVSTGNSFPKPLGKTRELEYLKKSRNGDISARNILVEKNMRLVAHIAKKYTTSNIEYDDMLSIGTIGLIKAINTFDFEKGNKLATYASRCIENEILMVIRSVKKSANDVSLDEPIGKDKEGNEITYIDVIETEDEDVIEKITNEGYVSKIYEVIDDTLNEREKMIIINRFGLYNNVVKTQQEIADELKISRSYISRIEKKAIDKLAKILKIYWLKILVMIQLIK